jgi:hypothetical protein
LMRALKVTGDATKQEDYESCKYFLGLLINKLMNRAVKGHDYSC